MSVDVERRAMLDRPYRMDYEASIRRKMAQPKGLSALLAWYLAEWSREVPVRIHTQGVWRDYAAATEDRHAEGGSLLGSPRLAEPFRRYIENSPFQLDQDGAYARPVHAAIARLAGYGGHAGTWDELGDRPFMARFLFRLALAAGDLDAPMVLPPGTPPQMVRCYAEAALYALWRRWRPESDLQPRSD